MKKNFQIKKFILLSIISIFLAFLVGTTITYYYMLITSEMNWNETNILVGSLTEVCTFLLMTIFNIQICMKKADNKFGKWSRKHLKGIYYSIFFVSFSFLSYNPKLYLTVEDARAYIAIEWTIFAIVFAFSFLMITLMGNKISSMQFDFRLEKDSIFKSLMQRKANTKIISVIKDAYPNMIYLSINLALLIVGTVAAYPTLKITFGTVSQLFINLSMYYTVLNFITICGSILYSLAGLKLEIQSMNSTVNKYEEAYYEIFLNKILIERQETEEFKKPTFLNNIKNLNKKLDDDLLDQLIINTLFDENFNLRPEIEIALKELIKEKNKDKENDKK